MKRVKYFAYGSNISLEQMRRRLGGMGHIFSGTPYTLKNWKLEFNIGGFYVQHTYANIVPKLGESIEGLIYEINLRQLFILDGYEALYSRKYFKIDGEKIFTYVGNSYAIQENKKPELHYLNTILNGCFENNLITTYNKLIEFKESNYKLKKGNKHKKR